MGIGSSESKRGHLGVALVRGLGTGEPQGRTRTHAQLGAAWRMEHGSSPARRPNEGHGLGLKVRFKHGMLQVRVQGSQVPAAGPPGAKKKKKTQKPQRQSMLAQGFHRKTTQACALRNQVYETGRGQEPGRFQKLKHQTLLVRLRRTALCLSTSVPVDGKVEHALRSKA